MKNRKIFILVLLFLTVVTFIPAVSADVVVTETRTTNHTRWAWGGADTPIGDLFYMLGDVVAMPFDLLGEIF